MAFFNIGSIKTKKELDEDGKPQYYLEIDREKIKELRINGVVIDHDFIDVDRPTAKFKRMLIKKTITPEEYQKKVDGYDATIDPATGQPRGKQHFVKFDVTAKTKK